MCALAGVRECRCAHMRGWVHAHMRRVGPNRMWDFRLRIYTPYKPYIYMYFPYKFRIFEISTFSEINFRGVIL